jgi:hypothetical protein
MGTEERTDMFCRTLDRFCEFPEASIRSDLSNIPARDCLENRNQRLAQQDGPRGRVHAKSTLSGNEMIAARLRGKNCLSVSSTRHLYQPDQPRSRSSANKTSPVKPLDRPRTGLGRNAYANARNRPGRRTGQYTAHWVSRPNEPSQHPVMAS